MDKRMTLVITETFRKMLLDLYHAKSEMMIRTVILNWKMGYKYQYIQL
jgi:hypothetical protein